MSNEIVVAVIGLVGSTIGAFIGVVASANLTAYRIEQLEKKVEKHNGVIERTFKLEGRMQEAEHDIIELKGAKKMILPDKYYKIIKWGVLTVLPASSVLVATLGKAYGWQQTDMAVLTINAIATFLGVVTGVSAYNLKDKE